MDAMETLDYPAEAADQLLIVAQIALTCNDFAVAGDFGTESLSQRITLDAELEFVTITYLNQFHTPGQSHYNHACIGQGKCRACPNAHRGTRNDRDLIVPVEFRHIYQFLQIEL